MRMTPQHIRHLPWTLATAPTLLGTSPIARIDDHQRNRTARIRSIAISTNTTRSQIIASPTRGPAIWFPVRAKELVSEDGFVDGAGVEACACCDGKGIGHGMLEYVVAGCPLPWRAGSVVVAAGAGGALVAIILGHVIEVNAVTCESRGQRLGEKEFLEREESRRTVMVATPSQPPGTLIWSHLPTWFLISANGLLIEASPPSWFCPLKPDSWPFEPEVAVADALGEYTELVLENALVSEAPSNLHFAAVSSTRTPPKGLSPGFWHCQHALFVHVSICLPSF